MAAVLRVTANVLVTAKARRVTVTDRAMAAVLRGDEQLIELSGKPVEIVYTGLREGEKLDEELFGEGEVDVRPIHPLISHAHVPPFSAGQAAVFDAYADPAEISGQLASACANLLISSHAHVTDI